MQGAARVAALVAGKDCKYRGLRCWVACRGGGIPASRPLQPCPDRKLMVITFDGCGTVQWYHKMSTSEEPE